MIAQASVPIPTQGPGCLCVDEGRGNGCWGPEIAQHILLMPKALIWSDLVGNGGAGLDG